MEIILSGYWRHNLGDDLFLKVIVDRYSDINFKIVVSKDQEKNYSNFNNLDVLYYNRILDKISNIFNFELPGSKNKIFHNALRKSGFCIEIGGSLFVLPKEGMGKGYYDRKEILKICKHYFIIGSNFGPYFNRNQLSNYRALFSKVDNVTFRDKRSFRLFNDLSNVDYYPDVIFNVDTSKYQKESKYILISIINPQSKSVYINYKKWILRIIKKYVKNGENILLMSFCEAEGDLDFARDIVGELGYKERKNVKIYNHEEINNSLAVIAKAKAIVATRFHSMILSWLFNKPTFVVSYNPKIEAVIQDLAPEQSFEYLNNITESSKVTFTTFDEDYFINVKESATDHFSRLDKLISKMNEEKI